MSQRRVAGTLKRLLIVIVAALAFSACASPAEMQNMIVNQQSFVLSNPETPFRNSIRLLQVNGGESTNPLWTSEVGNSAFRGALEASLRDSSLLAVSLPKSRFDLYATLKSMDQPLIGLDLTVNSNVNYRVVERESKESWFDTDVLASYTATFSDSPLAIQRLRFANEGSIRENIKQFIKRLISEALSQKK